MSPRHFFALASVPLIMSMALTGCRDTPFVCDCIPPVQPEPARTEIELINQLKTAYQKRDYDLFARLFHPDYQFYCNEVQPDGTTSWGLAGELRIYRRMFNPDDAVPPEWRVANVDISMHTSGVFRDAPEYYFDPTTNPTGLRRENFAATQAGYVASVFLQTQGETQYRVDGAANFVVVNDLSKAVGDDGKFLIYRWYDLEGAWTRVKLFYRN